MTSPYSIRCGGLGPKGIAVSLFLVCGVSHAEPSRLVASQVDDAHLASFSVDLSTQLPVDIFWQQLPRDGALASARTEVRAACSSRFVYIEAVAYAAQDGIRASRVRRDRMQDDQDYVNFLIDPTGGRRSALFFKVGAAGSIADGVYHAGANKFDLQPDFDVLSKAQITDSGYKVGIRIPWDVLATQGGSSAAMSFVVLRNATGRAREVHASEPIAVNSVNLLSSMGNLDVSACSPSGSTFSAGASVTGTQNEARQGSVRQKDSDREIGGWLRWENGSTTSVDLTWNPDFSQVELDVPQLQSNTTFAINLPEKRDFFLRDVDLFDLPTRSSLNEGGGNQIYYSRTITDPSWGARMAYRNAGLDVAGMAVEDDGGGVTSIPGPFGTGYRPQGQSKLGMVRVSKAGAALRIGAVAGMRTYQEDDERNEILGADLTWQISDLARVRSVVVQSRTRPGEHGVVRSDATGSYAFADILAMGSKWETSWTIEQADRSYRNDIGYTPQADFRQVAGLITRRWRPSGRVNNVGASLKMIGSETVSTGELIQARFAPGIWFGGEGDLDLLVEYVPGERRRSSGYGGRIHTLDYMNLRLGRNLSRHVPSLSFSATFGDQIDYDLDEVGKGSVLSLSARIRPIDWLEVVPSLNRYQVKVSGQSRTTETTGQLLINASLGQRSFVRYIGQFNGNERYQSDALGEVGLRRVRDNGGALHSLVASYELAHNLSFDIGVTRSRSTYLIDDRRTETGSFAKLEGRW